MNCPQLSPKYKHAQYYVASVLHLPLYRPKQRKNSHVQGRFVTRKDGIFIQKYIRVPANYNISYQEVQYVIWHEIGHYFDFETVNSKELKYSRPYSETLKKHGGYIIEKDRLINPHMRKDTGKQECDELMEKVFADRIERAEKRFQRYLNSPEELFANGFAEYVLYPGDMIQKVPELAAMYEIIFSGDSRMKEIFGQNEPNWRNTMAIVSESEYKGNPMLVIKASEDDKFPFSFGVKKAKLILENLDAIKDFVNKHNLDKKG